ncbi:MAG TPA: hypothetical protein VFV53_04770 [Candidatus Limnocylindrales bacterium]|nr:hypothetical protein [Candidatus Limnocylindrales bacterium]
MTIVLTRLRPLLIGLVVLLFTAGIAFAGKPSTPADGLTVASEASGKTVPVRAQAEEDEDLDEEVDEEAPEAEEQAESEEEAGDNCATDPTGLTDEALAALRHGSVVCWAAHQETPEGYANHGEWVSEWARKNHGHEDTAGDETEAVAPAAAGRAHGKAKDH